LTQRDTRILELVNSASSAGTFLVGDLTGSQSWIAWNDGATRNLAEAIIAGKGLRRRGRRAIAQAGSLR
jgi:hypothetical protein